MKGPYSFKLAYRDLLAFIIISSRYREELLLFLQPSEGPWLGCLHFLVPDTC